MTRRRVTLKDVAKHVGYSESTVSLVLNDRQGTRIAASTAAKIRAGAAELDYSPDPSARGLRLGSTNAIGFISNEVMTTRFASAMITGAVARAQHHGQVLIMSEIGVGNLPFEVAARTLLDRRVGALVVGQMRAREVTLPETISEVPTVVVNGYAKAVAGSVLPDEFQAGWDAIDYLLKRGHRRLARIGWDESFRDPMVSATISKRFAGMNERMNQEDLEFVAEFNTAAWEAPSGKAALSQILSRCAPGTEPTAVVCANDRLAFGVYQGAVEVGLEVGTDLSVISFDDEQLASYLEPGLTTMRLPYQEMGELGVEMALGAELRRVLVPMPLIERSSVQDLT